MADQKLIDRMANVLKRLSSEITVMDRSDASGEGERWPDGLRIGVCQMAQGRIWLPVRQPQVMFSCGVEVPNAQDLLLMAESLIMDMAGAASGLENMYSVYRRGLRGELTDTEVDALCHEHHIPIDMPRCVLRFHIGHTDNVKAFDLLHDITPLESGDVLIDMDRHTCVLLKNLSESEDLQELAEYSQALQETLLNESGHAMTVGIGDVRRTFSRLHESWDESRRALEIGSKYRPGETVHVYRDLILERFLAEQKPEIAASYHALLFNHRTAKVLNEEMLSTIEAFFDKDLNLSDAARSLFIHRNTLVYRLDKVQKLTGLDLRRFNDAVTFRLLMKLDRRAEAADNMKGLEK